MRTRNVRTSIVALAAVLPLVLASPASAASVRVNAADNITRSGARGQGCSVLVDNFDDHDVTAFCWSDGAVWFKVRVPGVEGSVTRVQAAERGDCSGQRITWQRQVNAVIVRIAHVGEFDCLYDSVVVRTA